MVKKHLQEAKIQLQSVYQHLEEDLLKHQIAEVQKDFHSTNTTKAWKVVNSITNRKPSTTGKLKGNSPEERKRNWFDNLFFRIFWEPHTLVPQ